jgi:hypothetical protein
LGGRFFQQGYQLVAGESAPQMNSLQGSRQVSCLTTQGMTNCQVAPVDIKPITAIQEAQRTLTDQASYQIPHDRAASMWRHDEQQITREWAKQCIHTPNLALFS